MKKAAIVVLVLLNVALAGALLINASSPAQAQGFRGATDYAVVVGHIDTDYDGIWITDLTRKKLIVFRYDKGKRMFQAFQPRKLKTDFPDVEK